MRPAMICPRRVLQRRNLPLRKRHAMLERANNKGRAGGVLHARLQSLASGGKRFGDDQHEISSVCSGCYVRPRFQSCWRGCLRAGQDRQDRRDVSAERRRRQRRRSRQGGDRNRDGHHQQRPSRTRQFPAGQERRPRRPRRRQGRGGVRRQPGQPRHRPEPDAAPDHRREGGRADRRLSVRHHADRERDRREIRHSLRQRRVGRGQSHRARLQVVLPHHAGRVRLRQDLFRLPHRHEGVRRQDRQHRAGARQHRIRHLGLQRHHQRLQGEGR